jgi:hypothetical protein
LLCSVNNDKDEPGVKEIHLTPRLEIPLLLKYIEPDEHGVRRVMKMLANLLVIISLSSFSALAALGASSIGHGGGGGGGHLSAGPGHSGPSGGRATVNPRGTAFLGHHYYHHYGGGLYFGGWYEPYWGWDYYYPGYGYYDGYYGYGGPAYSESGGGQAYSPSGPSYEELGKFWGKKLKQGGPAVHDEFISFLQSDLLRASDAGRALFQGGFVKGYGKDGAPLLNHALDEAKGRS